MYSVLPSAVLFSMCCHIHTHIHIHKYIYICIYAYTYVYTYRYTHEYATSCRPSNSRYVHPLTHKSCTLLPIRLANFGQPFAELRVTLSTFWQLAKVTFKRPLIFQFANFLQLWGNLQKLLLKVDFGKTSTCCPCWRSNSQSDTLTPQSLGFAHFV
jgi:hypothetical protein